MCRAAGLVRHHRKYSVVHRTDIGEFDVCRVSMVRKDLWDVIGLIGTGSDSYSVPSSAGASFASISAAALIGVLA
jgi:hypothetical protein